MLYSQITERHPITYGWSKDKKFRALTESGETFFLRISAPEREENRRLMFEMQKKVAALGVPMCLPLEFGICDEGVYTIYSWVSGEDASSVVPDLSPARQYDLGKQVGRLLTRIHTIPAPAGHPNWETFYGRKLARYRQNAENCPIKLNKAELFYRFIDEHKHLIHGRPSCYQHGDFHIGNIMLKDGKPVIIDFDRYDFGDPYEELKRLVWSAETAPHFSCGIIDGYFNGDIPSDFWPLLALYIAGGAIGSLPWAIPYGEREIHTMQEQGREILRYYDDFQTTVPLWYRDHPTH